MQCKHKTLFFLSGTLWLTIGIILMTLGLRFLISTLAHSSGVEKSLLLDMIRIGKATRENGVIILITMALMVGFFKGKFLLSKSAKREIDRITELPNPTSIKNIYSKKYYLLLSCMALIGFSMRLVPLDIRGFIDIAIGSALINGSRAFYRACFHRLTTDFGTTK